MAKTKRKKSVNGNIPTELQLDGNPVVGFRVPRGLLEAFDAKYGKDGRAALREMGIKWMQRAVNSKSVGDLIASNTRAK